MQRTDFIAAYKVAETESDRKLLIESFAKEHAVAVPGEKIVVHRYSDSDTIGIVRDIVIRPDSSILYNIEGINDDGTLNGITVLDPAWWEGKHVEGNIAFINKYQPRPIKMSDTQLRHLQCWHCTHCFDKSGDKGADASSKSRCAKNNTWGSMERAFFCEEYLDDNRGGSDTAEYHGYRIKNRQVEDWRTKNQWAEAGYHVKPGEQPTMMFKDFRSAEDNNPRGLFGYYLPEQVERNNNK